MTSDYESYLAYFPGPKGENSDYVKELFDKVLDDYFHWRRNYYPADTSLMPPIDLDGFKQERSDLEERITEMLGRLRRSFPFYSPRYIAHQQGETTIPALVGSLAGLLYNSNNVTSETGAVTVEYEIDACNRLLEMIGFVPPPDPPALINEDSLAEYRRLLAEPYAWCHLTSGGTVANIEALWVARAVKYFPLAVQDVARKHSLDISVVKTSSEGSLDEIPITELTRAEVIGIAPSESLALIARYLEAVKRFLSPADEDEGVASLAWRLLEEDSDYSLANGLAKCLTDFPPAIFVSGAAHYSIQKAMDLLGLGRNAVIKVAMDSQFRLDPLDLEQKVIDAIGAGRFPLAVIGIAGTTEEGAIDPIGQILNIRRSVERRGSSFWVHVDAAWGGYFRTILRPSLDENIQVAFETLFEHFDIPKMADFDPRRAAASLSDSVSVTKLNINTARCRRLTRALLEAVSTAKNTETLVVLKNLLREVVPLGAEAGDSKESSSGLFEQVSSTVADDLVLEVGRYDYESDLELSYSKEVSVSFDDHEIVSSLFHIKDADSVTVDPHKMGYVNYPCGAVAFQNDWVRLVVRQKAPYITSVSDSRILHLPPRHLVESIYQGQLASAGTVATEAFAPYTLEGSRPSFPATALWLNTELIPLDRRNHGAIVRSSWISARELYEWLVSLDDALSVIEPNRNFEVVTFARRGLLPAPPDSNIVIFGIKRKGDSSLSGFNSLTQAVYESFAIQAEHGQRQYSYAQPFFLSRTVFSEPGYDYSTLADFFEAAGIEDARNNYSSLGVTVLRSAVMNPYLLSLRRSHRQEVLREFVQELTRVAQREAGGKS